MLLNSHSLIRLAVLTPQDERLIFARPAMADYRLHTGCYFCSFGSWSLAIVFRVISQVHLDILQCERTIFRALEGVVVEKLADKDGLIEGACASI